MLIEHSGESIRDIKSFDAMKDDERANVWRYKETADAVTHGAEIVWPFENWVGPEPKNGEFKCEILSEKSFAITLPSHVRVREGCSLFIMPHPIHWYSNDETKPELLPQMIEYDWWPKPLRILFRMKTTAFEYNMPLAQALVVPRKEYTIKRMDDVKIADLQSSTQFLEQNADDYITRRIEKSPFPPLTNLYERLSQLNKSGELPLEMKKKPTGKPQLSLGYEITSFS